MSSAGRAVIYDHSTLLVDDRENLKQFATTLGDLKRRGHPLVVFSTHQQGIDAKLAARGLPAPDLFVTRQEAKAAKGSPNWVRYAAGRLGLLPHNFFYVGDDEQDWRTAINSGVMYMHAKWAKPVPK